MSIYKDCDIRGIYGDELTDNDAYVIGKAVGTLLAGKSIAVGGDARLSTPALKTKFIDGLFECGGDVVDIGTVPTPALYFSRKYLKTYGCAMITASHNPAKYNGIKLMLGEAPITPDDINEIKCIAEGGRFVQKPGKISAADILPEYIDSICVFFPDSRLSVVLDCCDGAASLTAPAAFIKKGFDVTELFCGLDGSFPNRDPNPAVYSNLAQLRKKVLEVGAQFGVGFDGDGDRAVFIDDKGEVVTSENSLALIARYTLKEGDSLVYDQKSCSTVAEETRKLGAVPVMERSGHAFIKKTFLEMNSALAGEISGHFFFRELGYDDGLFAALKMAEIIKLSGKSLSELNASLPKKVITPDIRLKVPFARQQELLDKVGACAAGYQLSHMDGVRAESKDGWILIRKSVTEEAVTVRMEGKDRSSLLKLADTLGHWLPEVRDELSKQVRAAEN